MPNRLQVLNSGSLLTAAAVKYLCDITPATTKMSVGTGLAAWDIQSPVPQPAVEQSTLITPLADVALVVAYLDPLGLVSATPTTTLRFTGTFAIGVANGTIREIGVKISNLLYGLVNLAGASAIVKPAGGADYVLTRNIIIRF